MPEEEKQDFENMELKDMTFAELLNIFGVYYGQEIINATIRGGTINGVPVNTYKKLVLASIGGDGSDEDLIISSGTTTLDCGGETTLIKNYRKVSITGTAKLAFSNPHSHGTTVVLRSQGDMELTSVTTPCIDASSLGGEGGAGSTSASPGSQAAGGKGYCGSGGAGGTGGGATAGSGGHAGNKVASTVSVRVYVQNPPGYFSWQGTGIGAALPPLTYFTFPIPGGGGGGGSCGQGFTAGSGGIGGGGLLLECRGNLTFTGTIWAKGNTGATGTGASGGSGAGGSVKIMAVNIITNTGTINVDGGTEASIGQSLIAQYKG